VHHAADSTYLHMTEVRNKQMEDHPLNRPPDWLREGLDLVPGIPGEANKAITH
jgi:hypothetical protein